MRKNVTIHTDQIIGIPNPKMWGIFYEEINHAGDGGLYAELIRNRNFADIRLPEGTVYAGGKVRTKRGHVEDFDISDPLPGWKLKASDDFIASMDLTENNPRNPECPQQLRLAVMNAGRGVTVYNTGYWGIPVKKQSYYGFIIARGEGIRTIKVGLMHSSGVVSCSQEITLTDSFDKYPFCMECPSQTENARFFIETKDSGILYVDFVTLFPEDTYRNQPYGFRNDLMQMLKGLNPGFVRFPGGCVVEGINLENAIHWKKTRGPIEDRPGHWDLWGYRATDGLGMLEFCQLAEEFNADIMYVVNCGMSCQARREEVADEDGIEYWLQNALDGIEYIYGDASTPYGALRAADGHPEPFALKYVEIGNENYGDAYEYRYKKFYSVLKEKYPELTMIVTGETTDAIVDMFDHHYYTPPQDFPNLYQTYDQDGVLIYVGEYACNQETGYGNLLGAVSEAVFMTHMENRCNRVRIASYAPLFCREQDRRWPVNLINFDGSRVFGIPSYEVQKMFSAYSVDKVFQADCPVIAGADTNLYVTAGEKDGKLIIKAANFGTQETSAVFAAEGRSLIGKEVYLLASEHETDTNSLLSPNYVSMVPSVFRQEADAVTVELPPYSFAVIVCEK